MKKLRWKKTKREDYYGVWHELNLGLRDYGCILIREPICLRQLTLDSIDPNPSKEYMKYLSELYHDHNEGICPQKRECGWRIDCSSFGWNEPLDETFQLRRGIKNPEPIQINSFEEARSIAEKHMLEHIEKFTKRLLEAE
jgi:hypothetical protein